jgi:hypothetical protein
MKRAVVLSALLICLCLPAHAVTAKSDAPASSASDTTGDDRNPFFKPTAVDDSTDPAELRALADNPAVILDVTDLDLGRLPTDVKARLYSDGETFSAPNLRTSGPIFAEKAKEFSVPKLQTSGDLWVSSAASFSAPELQHVVGMTVPNEVMKTNPPQTKAVMAKLAARHAKEMQNGGIFANAATSFDAPKLQTVGSIQANAATNFNVPQLRTAGNIQTGAKTFDAPLLQTSEDITAFNAMKFTAPKLQTSGLITVPVATSFSAPKLQTVKTISAPAAVTFDAPLLKGSKAVFAPPFMPRASRSQTSQQQGSGSAQ